MSDTTAQNPDYDYRLIHAGLLRVAIRAIDAMSLTAQLPSPNESFPEGVGFLKTYGQLAERLNGVLKHSPASKDQISKLSEAPDPEDSLEPAKFEDDMAAFRDVVQSLVGLALDGTKYTRSSVKLVSTSRILDQVVRSILAPQREVLHLELPGTVSAEQAKAIAEHYDDFVLGRSQVTDGAAPAPAQQPDVNRVTVTADTKTVEAIGTGLVDALTEQTLAVLVEMGNAARAGKRGWEDREWFEDGELSRKVLEHVVAGDQRSLTQAAVLLTFLRCHKANFDERLIDGLGGPK